MIDEAFISLTRKDIKSEIEKNLEITFAESNPEAHTEIEVQDLFDQRPVPTFEPGEKAKEIRYLDAITEGMKQAMQRHDNLVIMGQDIADIP